MSTIIIIISILFVLSLLIIFSIYNGLIAKKNGVANAFAAIDTQLKKRYDLIPNIISAVKTYMKHEKTTLENITSLRTKAMADTNPLSDDRIKLDNQISKSLGSIMVAVENYPDLKSSANFVNLQKTLNEVESQISAARRAYNAAVTDYNNGIEMFPSSIIASRMKYKRKDLFVIEDKERENVNVKNLFED